ncbi:MAG TPA: hypothetical protein VGK58_19365 [Lacipirellulaceae bacterium]
MNTMDKYIKLLSDELKKAREQERTAAEAEGDASRLYYFRHGFAEGLDRAFSLLGSQLGAALPPSLR